ncbi:hypothetical protein HZI31_06620 [Serratia fonticola]|uniref:hypothetical protein n=1 Tax=Serratia fonticola TaxID=47917 RepID=UPI0015C6440C|nr:hypothetical protein [Serratia fonticola]NYA42979.1 hypothetical protein [Serratia fonticola]
MNVKVLFILAFLLPSICLATDKPEVYRDRVTLTGGARNLSSVLEGCESHSGLFLAKRIQFSDSGNTIKLIQFQRGDGDIFAIPTNFDQLDKAQYEDLQKMVEEGQKYWITFSVCGSGGFTSLIDINYSIGM